MGHDAAFQPKLIYLARRHPHLSRAGFVERWRRHGALGMSLPRWRNIARYVHCDVALADDSGYDGVGLIWHRSAAHRAAHVADTDSRLEMERDELETFSRPIVADCLLARASGPGPGGDSTVEFRKLFVFARADPGGILTAAARQVRNRVRNLPLPPERAGGWGLSFEVIDELWFEDERRASEAARQLAVPAAAAGAVVLRTNEVILYEAA